MRQGGQGRQGRKFNHAIPQNKVVRLLETRSFRPKVIGKIESSIAGSAMGF